MTTNTPTDGTEDEALADSMETWQVYQTLRSLRKTGREVHASKSAVSKRLRRVDEGLRTGELEIVGGKMRRVENK